MSADVELKLYRPYFTLLNLGDDELTHDEKKRLVNIKKIPYTVQATLESRAEELQKKVMALEAERDEIIDFLNGEWDK